MFFINNNSLIKKLKNLKRQLKQWIAIQNGTAAAAQQANSYTTSSKSCTFDHENHGDKYSLSSSIMKETRLSASNSSSHAGYSGLTNYQTKQDHYSIEHEQQQQPYELDTELVIRHHRRQHYTAMSRSNESIVVVDRHHHHQQQLVSSAQTNHPRKSVTTSAISNASSTAVAEDETEDWTAESIRNQLRYYQAIHRDEMADILSLKEMSAQTITFKAKSVVNHHRNQVGDNHHSKFRPFANYNRVNLFLVPFIR